MLKWKTYKFGTISNKEEKLTDLLAGFSGKNRKAVFVTGDIAAEIFIRLYRDNEQFVNFECDLITTSAPLLPVEIPLGDGQLLKAGFYNLAAGDKTPSIAIGYEEA